MMKRCLIAVLACGLAWTSACESEESESRTVVLAETRPADELTKDFHAKDSAVREAAVRALARMGADAIPCVEAELSDADADVRYSAISTLAGMRECALPAAPSIAACLEDVDVPIRRQAAFSLFHIGEPAHRAVVLPLGRAMDDSDAYVRRYSAKALGKMGRFGYPALDALRAHCHEDRDRFVREESQAAAEIVETEYNNWRISQGEAHPEWSDR